MANDLCRFCHAPVLFAQEPGGDWIGLDLRVEVFAYDPAGGTTKPAAERLTANDRKRGVRFLARHDPHLCEFLAARQPQPPPPELEPTMVSEDVGSCCGHFKADHPDVSGELFCTKCECVEWKQ